MKPVRLLLLLAVACATFAGTASAAPDYFARAGTSDTIRPPTTCQEENTGAVHCDVLSPFLQDFFTVFHSGEGHAAAGAFGVRAGGRGTLHVATSPDNPSNFIPPRFIHNGGGFAYLTVDDLVISGPASSVPAALRVFASGIWETSAHASGSFIGDARSGISVVLEILLNGNYSRGTITGNQTMAADGHVDVSLERTGLFGTFAGSGILSTDSVDLPTGTPLTLTLKLDVNGSAFFEVSGVGCCEPPSLAANGLADFAHSITFPTGEPVFDLPSGYTVNAPSVGIVNNRWYPDGPPTDTTPPAIDCDQPDTVWHAANVSLNCTATDPSGLQDGGDATFALTTDVASGEERADAMTGTREVCDSLGNCATAGPLGPIKVDRKAPSVAISSPSDGAAYTLGQAVNANYQCSDEGSGVASCAGPVANGGGIDTASVGAKTFAVTARDAAGNTASRLVGYAVGYGICVLYDQTQVKKLGSTVPIKLQLCNSAGLDVSSPATLVHAAGLARVSDNVSGTVQDSGNANPDSDFRYDSGLGGSGGYIYNLSTKDLSAGTWSLRIAVNGDPTTHTVQFQLR